MNADAFVREVLDQPIFRTKLGNGLTVVFARTSGAAVASAQLWIKTGSIHEGKWLGSGLSHAVEHMVFKRAGGRDAAEISRLAQSVGGLLNAYTSFDRTVFHIDLPSEGLPAGLTLLADLAFRPEFLKEDWKSERFVILRELAMTQDDPDEQRARLLMECAYRAHPYRFPVIGHLALFESLKLDDLAAYHMCRYAPNNAVLVLAGNLPQARAMRLVERTFAKIPMRRVEPVCVAPEPPQLALRQLRMNCDVSSARGAMAYVVPGLGHPDAPALAALALLLGQGMSSILWRELRERKAWAHQIEANFWGPGERGLLEIFYACSGSLREQVERRIRDLAENFGEKDIAPAMLEKVVRSAQMGEINARRSASTLAARLGTEEVTIGDLGFARNYFARLKSLTPADVAAAAKKWLTGQGLSMVSVDPHARKRKTAAKSADKALADFSEETLPNGVRLLLQPCKGYPKIHFKTACLGGTLSEGSGRYGATALGATLLARDTQRRSASEIAAQTEALGVYFSEYAGNNSFGLSAECLPCDMDFAVELLGEALTQAAFLPKTFEVERKGQVAGLRERDDDIVDFGRYKLREAFFGKHPYAVENLGTLKDLRALTAKQVCAHMRKLVCGENLVVAVSGDFDASQMAETLARWLEKLPRGESMPIKSGFSGPLASERTLVKSFEQALAMEAYFDPGVRAKDFHAFEILDEIVSGLSARLYLRVREELGLAYFVGSERVLGLDAGMFVFFAGTRTEHLAQVKAEIACEVARLRRGDFEPGELERCKMRLKAGRRMSLQTPASRAGNAVLNALYGLDPNAWRYYDADIDKVRPEQIAKAAALNFSPKNRVALTVRSSR